MSRHIGQNEKWKKSEKKSDEYVSDFGIIKKNRDTWVALIKEGFSYRVCGTGFLRARSAMNAAEAAAQELRIKGSPLPPIHFPAHIFC